MGNLKNDDKLTAFIALSDHTGIGTLCGGGAIWKLSRSAAGGSLPVSPGLIAECHWAVGCGQRPLEVPEATATRLRKFSQGR